jgi:hypothetical protein
MFKFLPKILLSLIMGLFLLDLKTPVVFAQSNPKTFVIEKIDELQFEETTEDEATDSSSLASSSAEVEKQIQDKKDQDITETGGLQKSKLAAYLDEHPIGDLSWHNFLQHSIRGAISNGLPANIIVLILLFPLIASFIAASRHFVGLRGFGIYVPAVLSVAFVSSGILPGIIMFIAVLVATILSRSIVKKFKMPSLPKTAMLLLGVSIMMLALLIAASIFNISQLTTINIFPLLIIMLLSENFMSSQIFNSQKEALRITMETLLTAILCSLLISLDPVQQFVLLRPELSLIAVAAINLSLGKYTGLRLLEYLRFQNILNK